MIERVRAAIGQITEAEFITADVVQRLGRGHDSSTVRVAILRLCVLGELEWTGRERLNRARVSRIYRRTYPAAAQAAAERASRNVEVAAHLQGLALAWGEQRARTRDEERAAAD